MKSYKVVINNDEYNLVSDEGEARVLQVAALVDETIAALSSRGGRIDKHKVAVLAALQLASKYLQSEHLLTQRKKQEDMLIASIEQQLSSV